MTTWWSNIQRFRFSRDEPTLLAPKDGIHTLCWRNVLQTMHIYTHGISECVLYTKCIEKWLTMTKYGAAMALGPEGKGATLNHHLDRKLMMPPLPLSEKGPKKKKNGFVDMYKRWMRMRRNWKIPRQTKGFVSRWYGDNEAGWSFSRKKIKDCSFDRAEMIVSFSISFWLCVCVCVDWWLSRLSTGKRVESGGLVMELSCLVGGQKGRVEQYQRAGRGRSEKFLFLLVYPWRAIDVIGNEADTRSTPIDVFRKE